MGNLILIVFKAAKHKAEAKMFLEYLMKKENYIRYLLTDPSSYGPVMESAKKIRRIRIVHKLKQFRMSSMPSKPNCPALGYMECPIPMPGNWKD